MLRSWSWELEPLEPGAGAATFREVPEPEPIFLLVGAGARAVLFKAASDPAASLRQAKKKSLVLVSIMILRAV